MSSVLPARRVFVSHSHSDNDFSRKLVHSLVGTGLDVWYDERNLGAGYLGPTIERELQTSDAYIVILSPAAVASQWVQSEWYAAWELLREEKIRFFIPVIAAECEIPLLLRGMFRVDFTRERYDTNVKQLLQLLGVSSTAAPQEQKIPTQWEQAGTFLAHRRGVYCVDWSPDGSTLATGSYDRSVVEWDAASYNQVKTLAGHTQGINAVAWSPSGTTLASASTDNTLRV